MDSANRNKTWVGNMYRKFECMCQDVDVFITKDTVKYVGNQVQSVGDNMKRFYSDVVHDFLSPQNPVEQEGQATRRKQSNAIAETGLSFHNDGDAAICGSSHLSFKESMTMGAQGSHSSDNTSSESLQSSLKGVGPTTAQKDETLSKSFSDDPNLSLSSQIILEGDFIKEVKIVTEELDSTEYQNSSRSQLLSASHLEIDCRTSQEDEMVPTKDVTEGSSTLVEEFMTDESSSSDDKTLSEALMISTIEDYKDPVISKLSPTIQLDDTDEGSEFTDDGTVSSSFSSASSHVSDTSHYQRQLHGKTMRVEQSPNVGSDSSEEIALKSHTFSIDQDHKSQVTSVTSLNDPGLGSFHKSASEDELKHGCQLNQLTALVSPVETDPYMETIDLSDKEKLDFSFVQVDSNKPLNTVSSRPRRLKSYKKIIQDALTSRTKIVTEYKLLAIWYGDIDSESCQHSMDSSAIVPATSLHSTISQSCNCCESGWDLL